MSLTRFDAQAGASDVPAWDAAVVTPSDATVLEGVRALWVGAAGNVAVTMKGGTVVTFAGVPAGTILPTRVSKVMSTNTTATLILALK